MVWPVGQLCAAAWREQLQMLQTEASVDKEHRGAMLELETEVQLSGGRRMANKMDEAGLQKEEPEPFA